MVCRKLPAPTADEIDVVTSISADSQTAGAALAARNAVVLAGAQAFGGANASIAISLGGLGGFYLLGDDKSLATLPVTAFLFGTALGTIPAAALARRVGRRSAYIMGSVLSMVSGAVAAGAFFQASFWLFCLGMIISGSTNAFVQQYRFAAADTASPQMRPKVISWVLVGGIIAGIIGPQTAIHTKDLFAPIPFAGAFFAQIGLAIIALVILTQLRVPVQNFQRSRSSGRPLRQILLQPRFMVAVSCAIGSYSIMSLVMTAAPLAMVAVNHSQADAAWGIQWHVMAMFAPSLITGDLIVRYGAERIVAIGIVLLAGCGLLALSGLSLANFWGALILLGVGWNFGFIGATAMVTETYEPEERAKVQAANDFLIFGFVAVASLSSGGILNIFGWEAVNYVTFPMMAVCLALLSWWYLNRRSKIS
jgi:MFS family permease